MVTRIFDERFIDFGRLPVLITAGFPYNLLKSIFVYDVDLKYLHF